jgi:Zn-dependent peptidase ImmA (M78 family)
VAPALNDHDRLTIAAAMVQHDTPTSKAKRLSELAGKLDRPDTDCEDRPWEQGYALARSWMQICSLSTDRILDMDTHLSWLGVAVQDTELSDRNTSGVALALEGRAPFVLLNLTCAKHTDFAGHQYPSGRRFTLAHELCHLLVDRLAGAELALVSGPWAPRAIEQRANAFAAELLMPNALIERAYAAHGSSPRWGGYEELVDAAKTLDVSPDALSNHLHNQGYIGFAERDALRAQLSRARSATFTPRSSAS